MDDITEEELYQHLFKVANHLLEQSKLFTVSELAEHKDPTYEEVAKLAIRLAGIIENLAEITGDWDSERIALNARQAALHMTEIAAAISQKNKEALDEARLMLDKITFI